MKDDVALYVDLAREEGGPVCELGAGTGRVALAIARAGIEVVGSDVSEPMLDRFRAKIAAETVDVARRIEAVSGDMRSWGPEGRFRQVFIPFRSFLALLTRQDRHACLQNCHRILRAGGRLVLNMFHPSMAYMRQYSFEAEGSWREAGRWSLPDGGSLELIVTAVYDRLQQRVHARFRWIETAADGSCRTVEEPVEIAYIWRDELLLHLELAGFEVEHLWGGFDRSPLSAEGQEMIAVCRGRQEGASCRGGGAS
jgi:ubiquinone/menaquinone biosynthesis C-methylase UbiE